MRRRLLWLLMIATALVLALALVVNLRAVGDVALPPPDPRLPILLPDGEWAPLVDVIAGLQSARLPAEAQPLLPDASRGAAASAAAASVATDDTLYPGMPWGPVFQLAEHHRQAGRRDQALALFQSIPESDPDYAVACRRIALELVARRDGQPLSALPFAHAAVLSAPFDLNSWQDLARVYGAGLGFDTAGSD